MLEAILAYKASSQDSQGCYREKPCLYKQTNNKHKICCRKASLGYGAGKDIIRQFGGQAAITMHSHEHKMQEAAAGTTCYVPDADIFYIKEESSKYINQ